MEGAQWAKSASGNQVLALLEEARALRSKLALADATVRQLKEALSQGQLALVARRRAAMQERARLGRREYTLEQRVGFLNEKLEVAERRGAALAEEKSKMQEAMSQQLAEIASLQREKGEWLQDKDWQHQQMLELQGQVRHPRACPCPSSLACTHPRTRTPTAQEEDGDLTNAVETVSKAIGPTLVVDISSKHAIATNTRTDTHSLSISLSLYGIRELSLTVRRRGHSHRSCCCRTDPPPRARASTERQLACAQFHAQSRGHRGRRRGRGPAG